MEVKGTSHTNCVTTNISTKITKTEIFAFIAVLVFEVLSREFLFINRRDNRNC